MTAAQILIVEDDLSILNTLAYTLSRRGFGVHNATNVTEALKLARKLRPDLILLDIVLPEELGIRVYGYGSDSSEQQSSVSPLSAPC